MAAVRMATTATSKKKKRGSFFVVVVWFGWLIDPRTILGVLENLCGCVDSLGGRIESCHLEAHSFGIGMCLIGSPNPMVYLTYDCTRTAVS